MKLIHPTLRNTSQHFATRRHCYLLVFLLSMVATAHALEPRQPIPQVSLPTAMVNDITSLSAVDGQYELLVKFEDTLQARNRNGSLFSMTSRSQLTALENLVAAYGASFEQVLTATTCPNIQTLLSAAEFRSGRAQPDLEGLHRVIIPPTLSGPQLLNLRADLVARSETEFVELRPAIPGPPPSVGVTPDFSNDPPPGFPAGQGAYRGADPGADFDFANNLGLVGTGIRIAEVSPNYNFLHEDISGIVTHHPSGIFDRYVGVVDWDQWLDHGAATLSQNLAPDNGYGVTGMTTGADGHFYRAANWTGDAVDFRVEEAFCDALGDSVATGDGHVVYLELQLQAADRSWRAPLEVLPSIYAVTMVGTDAGVIVISPAGNGATTNLDSSTVSFIESWRALEDSGAIIVGAGTADISHDRVIVNATDGSTFGSRVNVQGWGENVVTAGYGDLIRVNGDINRAYTSFFSGTSAATPMVAGAAVLAQETALSLGLPALDSQQMRAFLAATGIPQGTAVPGNIGPFINVRRAVTEIADADISIQSSQSGTMITTTVTNHGPREADTIAAEIVFGGGTVYSLTPIQVPSGCQWNPNAPIPPGSQCAGQCPSLLECTFDDASQGQQFIIQHEVHCGPNQSFAMESEAALISVLNDPFSGNNSQNSTVSCTPTS